MGNKGRKNEQANPPAPGPEKKTYDEKVLWLAGLPTDEYERIRKQEAQSLAMRASALDHDVSRKRKEALIARAREQSQADLGLLDDELEEWSEPVDGAALLDEIYDTLRRFVIMSESALVATSLWIVFTHLIEHECVVTSPRLAIMSPEMQ